MESHASDTFLSKMADTNLRYNMRKPNYVGFSNNILQIERIPECPEDQIPQTSTFSGILVLLNFPFPDI